MMPIAEVPLTWHAACWHCIAMPSAAAEQPRFLQR
jgi:hypothetical protein